MENSKRRAVILTALQVEYDAVKSFLKDLHEDRHKGGAVYERGIFEAEGQIWEICIHEIGAGNATPRRKPSGSSLTLRRKWRFSSASPEGSRTSV